METAAISYRVADFLKQHPPFHSMEEEDLLKLARTGRVRFFEPNEYILWQESARLQVFVIQQGTVCLWDEKGADAKLSDVRGAGDMLGIDQLDTSRSNPYSARSASDVLIYAFPADEFESLVMKYPYAQQYVSAHGTVTAEYQPPEVRRDPQNIFLHELAARKNVPVCDARATIREAARQMLATGDDAIVVLDTERRASGVLTARSLLKWIENGTGDAGQPVDTLLDAAPPAIAANASVTDGVLAMGGADAGILAITSDGKANGSVHAIVTSRDLGQVFGDQPVEILRDISHAPDADALRDLNQRARALALHYLTSASSSDWLTRFTACVDAGIMKRIIAIAVPEELTACWCFSGSSGRGESLTMLLPQIVLIAEDGHAQQRFMDAYQRVSDLLGECGYLPDVDRPFEPSFHAASLGEWKQRFCDWINDPILKQIYLARPMFDLRPVCGRQSLWQEVDATVTASVNREFLNILANDCLASLPPLTFFQNAVLDETGAEMAVFHLEQNALRPLVDVGRVFGAAAGRVLGSSTLERFAMARTLLPDRSSIFREASEALRVVLWQQGRAGIAQRTAGTDLPPALLSRYDRQVLKSGFRSILRLLEFTADLGWLKTL